MTRTRVVTWRLSVALKGSHQSRVPLGEMISSWIALSYEQRRISLISFEMSAIFNFVYN